MKPLLITILFFICLYGISQNIVPNGSFEEYYQCPNNLSQFNGYVKYWADANPSTPDYFNSCSSFNLSSIPWNGVGYQYPRTGNAYAGLAVFADYSSLGREYITIKLDSILKPAKTYCVNFYVSLSTRDSTSQYYGAMYAIDCIGAYISDTSVNLSSDSIIQVIPQIKSPTGHFLLDTLNWMLISGTYTATGGEQYLTIGNFNTNTNYIHISNSYTHEAYYYVDDVSVYPCNATIYAANAGANIAICKGDSAQIGSAPHAQYLYSWQPVAGLSDTSIANPKASPAVTTTYYLHQKDFKFDETIDSVMVTVNPIPAVTASAAPANICSDSSSTLTAAGTANAYSWSNGSTGNQITVSPVTTTAYTVTGTGNYGCTNTFSLTITVKSCEDTTGTMFNVYPTLATDLFYLKYSNIEINNTHFELIDVCGRKVEDVLIENATGKKTMTTATIASGIYIYRLVSNSKTLYTGKILVVKLK